MRVTFFIFFILQEIRNFEFVILVWRLPHAAASKMNTTAPSTEDCRTTE